MAIDPILWEDVVAASKAAARWLTLLESLLGPRAAETTEGPGGWTVTHALPPLDADGGSLPAGLLTGQGERGSRTRANERLDSLLCSVSSFPRRIDMWSLQVAATGTGAL